MTTSTGTNGTETSGTATNGTEPDGPALDHGCRLIVSEPPSTVVDTVVLGLSAPGPHGRFTVLPRHVDTVIPIGAGLSTIVTETSSSDGVDRHARLFLAHGQGILVKIGLEIRAVFEHVVACDRVDEADAAVRAHFDAISERERRAGATLDRLQAQIARHLAARER